MRYTAPQYGDLPPVFLSTTSAESWHGGFRQASSSGAWSSANRIIYVPFTLHLGVTVFRYFWLNGATVGTDNFQIGVYRTDFTQVNEGTSTLSAGTANRPQFDDITNYYLGPGRYYMAMWGSGTTATVFRVTSGAQNSQGIYYETNASGLPATGTPVDPAGVVSAVIPLFGLALRATDP